MGDRIPASEPVGLGDVVAGLRADGVELVELSFVDNAGNVRVKGVPLDRLPAAARYGVGASPCFETFTFDDVMVRGRYLGGPDGDLRLVPDLDRLVRLAAMPGWAWAPADKFTQDGDRFVGCQRDFAARQVRAAADDGLTAFAAFEHEWALGRADSEEFVPAFGGPGYGQMRLEATAEYARELVAALRAQGLEVQQFHPEYALGQVELSVAAVGPVTAADDAVLVRHTVRALSRRHGWRASFAPCLVPGGAGSGGHLHLSVRDADGNLFAGGSGPHGLRPAGESFLAGVLRELPALVAIGAGNPASFLRLEPSRWAGVWQVWGREAREAALRLITGTTGTQQWAANVEVKCFDGTANPYLAVGAVLAAGLAGAREGLALPAEVTGDPAALDERDRVAAGIHRLPTNAAAAADALAGSAVLAEAMGPELHDAMLTVRRAEAERYADAAPDEIVAATCWRW
ncbi:L-glutamine synthetase [Saccharopolyspora kobensis]|uniref:Glutamine synthetase n=1 Tax=Saccharopolyspora kobensis TaxID=146035 RepID=A0A1H5UK18_9PSEU|nr:glutamine synthetase family protein [Saccharopolyspora kobensis]SEF75372.1 L-glutamine synthetase [Saccharopolyspora kobensis]SFC72520.1 glutamine synthetase [Saccharopolyspora kobensis]